MHLVTGDDEVLVRRAATDLVGELVGDADPALVLETFHDPDEYQPAHVADTASTPAFLGDQRVVVAHGVGQFDKAALQPLLDYLDDPLPTTTLVLVHDGGGRLSSALTASVKKAGKVLDAGTGTGRKRDDWWKEHLAGAPITIDADARELVRQHLGEDVGRLPGLVDTLVASYGVGARITATDVRPFLGETGSAKPWDLTDAIDQGDIAGALDALDRLLGSADSHPLQLLAVIANHFGRAIRLDGATVRTDKDAAELLGLRHPFPAKKARELARRAGSDGLAAAAELLAAADLDLRGVRSYGDAVDSGRLVLEVLVARLCRVARGRPVGTAAG